MNVGRIKIKYHPVKKEMHFSRWENGGFAEITSQMSCLRKYFHESKGNVILQNLGTEFFDEIKMAMDGIEPIVLDFEGTNLDYGDFINMVNYYNTAKSHSFQIGDLMELPDVQKIYEDIRDFSLEVINVFQYPDVDRNNTELKKTINLGAAAIKKRIEALESNDVNLCFVGSYSSGKSTLINAILGSDILPEAINSETAKMFKIININDDSVKISFTINNKDNKSITTLNWDREKETFCFDSGPYEDSIRLVIQQKLNEQKDARRHTQMREILSALNSQSHLSELENNGDSHIDGIIEVYYPIPLSDKINFTIFDTPGTDSDNVEHLDILRNALKEQTNSILIFVNWPNKKEGAGNRLLVELLNDINHSSSAHSTIDVGRSLFVMNGCDTLTDQQAFSDLRKGNIVIQKKTEKSEQDYNVNLMDKRLFFTSAAAAYAAKAIKNNTSTDKEIKLIKKFEYSLVEDDDAGYYKHNKLAHSQYETDEMMRMAEDEVKTASEPKDKLRLFIVNSGLFSLEEEILKYGEKYALAVKAKGMIDTVSSVIANLNNEAELLKRALLKDNEKLNREIEILITEMSDSIKKECKNSIESEMGTRDHAILEIDEEALKRYMDQANAIWNKMPSWAIFKDVEKIHKDVCYALTEIIAKHKDIYISKRKEYLVKRRDDLIIRIQGKINEFKDIDSESKVFISKIDEVIIPDPELSVKIDFEKTRRNFWFIKFVDQEKYRHSSTIAFSSEMDKRKELCKEELKTTWEDICNRIETAFISNIDYVSGQLQSLKSNRDEVVQKINSLVGIVNTLKQKESQLSDKIWGKNIE